MPLAGYQPEHRNVLLGGGNSFAVRGLSLNDVAVLIRTHFPDVEALFDLFDGVEDMQAEQMQALALSLLSNAPGFVANVIALAAGEGDASDAERLPAPVQVQALFDIGELTFTEVGGVKKSLETIASLLLKTDLKNKLKKIKTTKAG
jgi:hypothetical protein